jgi:hypothetical protein
MGLTNLHVCFTQNPLFLLLSGWKPQTNAIAISQPVLKQATIQWYRHGVHPAWQAGIRTSAPGFSLQGPF